MKWHEYKERDRIKQFYSKHTIKQFWDWWSDKEKLVMEIRIMNYNLIKETAKKFKIPYSISGVFVYNDIQLKNVISYTRDKATIWFGIQPRKKNWNKWNRKSFGGTDYNVECWKFLFIDIDRTNKEQRCANLEELKNCDILANNILDRLKIEKWNNSYMKICSGNGVQLLIKLDIPIKISNVVFDKSFQYSEEFDKDKLLLKKTIGYQISRFSKKFEDKLKVDIDKSCFNLNRVGALPVTKNYKYDGFTWRGIIELKNDENVGLIDYLLQKGDDIKEFRKRNVFGSKRELHGKNYIRKGKLKENLIVQFMLKNDLPSGQRNNYLWFSLKLLLRDSKFDINTKEFKEIHMKLQQKHGSLPTNPPEKRFSFNENVVNSYCIQNFLPPIYKLWPNKTRKINMGLETLKWEYRTVINEIMILADDTTIMEDLKYCKKQLVVDSVNVETVLAFINGCIRKYGEDKAKYICNVLVQRFMENE